jgi:hypothetical protein
MDQRSEAELPVRGDDPTLSLMFPNVSQTRACIGRRAKQDGRWLTTGSLAKMSRFWRQPFNSTKEVGNRFG